MPAQAGTQPCSRGTILEDWIPAFAGMTTPSPG
jgi:hypothetical protein